MQQFAVQQGSGYARLDPDHLDLLQSGLFVRSTDGELQATRSSAATDQGYWLLLPILLLLAPMARKGWLFALLLALPLLPRETLANEGIDAPALQQIRQDPLAALQQLDDPLWLGIAAYHAGNYQWHTTISPVARAQSRTTTAATA